MIRTLLIEDELLSGITLKNYLTDFCTRELEVIGIIPTVREAIDAIRLQKPDLIFLDIRLADGTGFDVLKEFPKPVFRIIFTTGFDQYALDAFRFHAVQYLMKPINVDELAEAVNQVVQQINLETDHRNIRAMLGMIPGKSPEFEELYIRHHKGFDVLKIGEIIYCQADGSCTLFYMNDGKKVISSKSLGYYDELLKNREFMRVHHSYLVNRKHISGYHNEGVISLSGKNSVPLGEVYRKVFMKQFMNH